MSHFNYLKQRLFQLINIVLVKVSLLLNTIFFFACQHTVIFIIVVGMICFQIYAFYTFFEFNSYKAAYEGKMEKLNLENTQLKEDLVRTQINLEIYQMMAKFCSKNANGLECKVIKNYVENSKDIINMSENARTGRGFKALVFPSKDPTLTAAEKVYQENIRKMSASNGPSFTTNGTKVEQNFFLKNFRPDHIKEEDFLDRSAKFKKMVEKAIEERKKK